MAENPAVGKQENGEVKEETSSPMVVDSPAVNGVESDARSSATPLSGEEASQSPEKEVPADVKPITLLSVDIGSNSSVVSRTTSGSTKLPVMIQNRISSVGTPTEIGFRENQRLFGEDCFTNDPANTVGNLKSLIGKKFSEVGDESQFHLASLLENEKGEISVSVKYCEEQHQIESERLLAMVIRQLVSYSKEDFQTPVLISIPRQFGEPELKALKITSKIAGINLVGCVHDLTAAALVYQFTRRQESDKPEVVLFADMGKTYFQLQLVEFTKDKFRVLSHHSEQLGGRDFTNRLRGILAQQIQEKYKIDVLAHPRNIWQMQKESQRLKKVLSTVPAVNFEYFIMDKDVSIPCSRAKFEENSSDLLARIQPAVEKVVADGVGVLKASGVEFEGLSLEIIGGGLIVPSVLQRIKASAGTKDARRSLDSQSCRSLGAGLFAALYFKGDEGLQLSGEGVSYQFEDPSYATVMDALNSEIPAELFEKGLEAEMKMCKTDQEVATLAAKRNEVEERIFFLRDRIRSSPEEVGLQSDVTKREKVLEILKEYEDWILYDEESANPTLEILEGKLTSMNEAVKEAAPKFYQYLEDLEIERKKMEEKARQDEAEMLSRPTRDKVERPLKKSEFIQAAEKRKQQGNMAIKEDDHDGAIVRYKQALTNFSQIREELTEEEQAEVNQIKLACYLNLAFCYLKSPGREIKVVQNCEEALTLDPENVKALFRRGSAYLKQKEWQKAKADFQAALAKDANNKPAQKQMVFVEKKIKEQGEKEKKMCARMFG